MLLNLLKPRTFHLFTHAFVSPDWPQVKALQAAIMDVGGPKLKQQQAAVDDATSTSHPDFLQHHSPFPSLASFDSLLFYFAGEVEKAVGLVEAAKVEATNAKRAADRAQVPHHNLT